MKSARPFNPMDLDVRAFAQQSGHLEGEFALASMSRLADLAHLDSVASPLPVTWIVDGEERAVSGGEPQRWLHVTAQARVWMDCQRCLNPVEQRLSVERSFLFAPSEEAAAELDADIEEDVLALTRSLDLRALIEDELLLALPLVPTHEICPQPLLPPGQDLHDNDEAEAAPHPFAALAALKRGGLPN